jgi:Ni,Fe-hydrogenase I cytochrome b subunit
MNYPSVREAAEVLAGVIVFAIIHVYLVFFQDYVERRGATTSMIGGRKFIDKD